MSGGIKQKSPLFEICRKKRFVPFSRNQRQVKGEKFPKKRVSKGCKKFRYCLRLTHRFQKFWLEKKTTMSELFGYERREKLQKDIWREKTWDFSWNVETNNCKTIIHGVIEGNSYNSILIVATFWVAEI